MGAAANGGAELGERSSCLGHCGEGIRFRRASSHVRRRLCTESDLAGRCGPLAGSCQRRTTGLGVLDMCADTQSTRGCERAPLDAWSLDTDLLRIAVAGPVAYIWLSGAIYPQDVDTGAYISVRSRLTVPGVASQLRNRSGWNSPHARPAMSGGKSGGKDSGNGG